MVAVAVPGGAPGPSRASPRRRRRRGGRASPRAPPASGGGLGARAARGPARLPGERGPCSDRSGPPGHQPPEGRDGKGSWSRPGVSLQQRQPATGPLGFRPAQGVHRARPRSAGLRRPPGARGDLAPGAGQDPQLSPRRAAKGSRAPHPRCPTRRPHASGAPSSAASPQTAADRLSGPRQAVGRLAGARGRLAHRPGVAGKASGGPVNGRSAPGRQGESSWRRSAFLTPRRRWNGFCPSGPPAARLSDPPSSPLSRGTCAPPTLAASVRPALAYGAGDRARPPLTCRPGPLPFVVL